jgi:hypothetical protein
MVQAFKLEIDPGRAASKKLLFTFTCDSHWLRLTSRAAMEAEVRL